VKSCTTLNHFTLPLWEVAEGRMRSLAKFKSHAHHSVQTGAQRTRRRDAESNFLVTHKTAKAGPLPSQGRRSELCSADQFTGRRKLKNLFLPKIANPSEINFAFVITLLL
jgi:hypothetical protein